MGNPKGRNGTAQQREVGDEELREFFCEMALANSGRGFSCEVQREKLFEKYGITWGRTKVTKERKRLGIPSVRKNNVPEQRQQEAIEEVLMDDPDRTWGVERIRSRLSKRGIITTRHLIRQFNNESYPEAVDRRFAATRKRTRSQPVDTTSH